MARRGNHRPTGQIPSRSSVRIKLMTERGKDAAANTSVADITTSFNANAADDVLRTQDTFEPDSDTSLSELEDETQERPEDGPSLITSESNQFNSEMIADEGHHSKTDGPGLTTDEEPHGRVDNPGSKSDEEPDDETDSPGPTTNEDHQSGVAESNSTNEGVKVREREDIPSVGGRSNILTPYDPAVEHNSDRDEGIKWGDWISPGIMSPDPSISDVTDLSESNAHGLEPMQEGSMDMEDGSRDQPQTGSESIQRTFEYPKLAAGTADKADGDSMGAMVDVSSNEELVKGVMNGGGDQNVIQASAGPSSMQRAPYVQTMINSQSIINQTSSSESMDARKRRRLANFVPFKPPIIVNSQAIQQRQNVSGEREPSLNASINRQPIEESAIPMTGLSLNNVFGEAPLLSPSSIPNHEGYLQHPHSNVTTRTMVENQHSVQSMTSASLSIQAVGEINPLLSTIHLPTTIRPSLSNIFHAIDRLADGNALKIRLAQIRRKDDNLFVGTSRSPLVHVRGTQDPPEAKFREICLLNSAMNEDSIIPPANIALSKVQDYINDYFHEEQPLYLLHIYRDATIENIQQPGHDQMPADVETDNTMHVPEEINELLIDTYGDIHRELLEMRDSERFKHGYVTSRRYMYIRRLLNDYQDNKLPDTVKLHHLFAWTTVDQVHYKTKCKIWRNVARAVISLEAYDDAAYVALAEHMRRTDFKDLPKTIMIDVSRDTFSPTNTDEMKRFVKAMVLWKDAAKAVMQEQFVRDDTVNQLTVAYLEKTAKVIMKMHIGNDLLAVNGPY